MARPGNSPLALLSAFVRSVDRATESTSQMGRFESGAMTEERNLTALAEVSGHWRDHVQA